MGQHSALSTSKEQHRFTQTLLISSLDGKSQGLREKFHLKLMEQCMRLVVCYKLIFRYLNTIHDNFNNPFSTQTSNQQFQVNIN